ncbi:MAG: hypothetical protein GY747_11365 [Planctomycetes bacterium]|nr:hypothetical protein [Planctomycetota bacterium]
MAPPAKSDDASCNASKLKTKPCATVHANPIRPSTGKTLHLGPRLLSFDEVTDEINSVTNRQVTYLPISSDDYRAAATAEVGADFANMLTDLMTEILDGRNESIGDGVQRALGRPARDFRDYCKSTAATGTWA